MALARLVDQRNYDTWTASRKRTVHGSISVRHAGILPVQAFLVLTRGHESHGTNPGLHRYMAWEEMYAAEGSDWFCGTG
jgi:hypothetical protein